MAWQVSGPTLLGGEVVFKSGSLLSEKSARGNAAADCGGPESGCGRLPDSGYAASGIGGGGSGILYGSVVQSLLSGEPYECVFADPPGRYDVPQFPIRNLDTGEVRLLDESLGELTASFQQGTHVHPQQLAAAGKGARWLSWWSQKHAKDQSLLAAAACGDVAVAQEALRQPTDGSAPVSVDAHDSAGFTALHLACASGHVEVVRLVVAARADVDARTSSGGLTALHLAARRGGTETLRLLLAGKADVLQPTHDGHLAIHLAATNGHRNAASSLIELGCASQLEHRNCFGQLPAVAAKDAETLQVFEEHRTQIGGDVVDSFARRTGLESGEGLRRNSRADFVQRLLGKVASTSEGSTSPGSSSSSQPSLWSACTPRSVGARTPRTPSQPGQKGVRGPFAKIKSSDQPVERVGPDSFEVVVMLGKGSFGEVYKVKHRTTADLYAMKVLQKSKIQKRNLQRYALSERNILSYVNHPYIVSLHYAFQTSSCLVMMLQFCPGGNLQQLISREKHLQDSVANMYTAEILLALCHLHERRIIFRDLKPENVVLDEERHAKLTDFGLSKEGVGDKGAKTFCGSTAFLAPEILAHRQHNHTVDIYGLGVMTFNMLTGLPPFYHHDRETLFANIRRARLDVPAYVSPEALAFIKATMQREPEQRLGAQRTAAVLEHPYFEHLDFDALFRRELPMPRQAIRRDSAGVSSGRLVGPVARAAAPASPFGSQAATAAARRRPGGDEAAGGSSGAAPLDGWDYSPPLPSRSRSSTSDSGPAPSPGEVTRVMLPSAGFPRRGARLNCDA